MPGNQNSGLRRNSQGAARAKQTLHAGAPEAARIVVEVARGKLKPRGPQLAAACYTLDQVLGKAKQRTEVSGTVGITLAQLARDYAGIIELSQGQVKELPSPGDGSVPIYIEEDVGEDVEHQELEGELS